jgi:hypothetical protein
MAEEEENVLRKGEAAALTRRVQPWARECGRGAAEVDSFFGQDLIYVPHIITCPYSHVQRVSQRITYALI